MIRSLPASIKERANETPNLLAVADSQEQLTWAELEQRSDRIAANLLRAGIRAENCVALFLERSTDFVVAALAVWKAGAAYLPLDPGTPSERLATILEDAQVTLLVTHRNKGGNLASPGVVILDLDRSGTPVSPGMAFPGLAADLSPERLAYVI